MKANHKDYYYKIKELEKIKVYPHEGIKFLDWEEDFNIINQYYIDAFGITDMQKKHDLEDDDEKDECKKVVALVINNKIVSQALILKIREAELEIGAVSTMECEKNKGYSRVVVSAAAEYIIKQGEIASLTTSCTNYPMQRVAEIVGMDRVL